MLTSSLNYHPHATCFGEIFNPLINRVDYQVEGYDMFDEDDICLRNLDFERFLNTRIFCEHPNGIKAVGFKAPHVHFQARSERLAWLVVEEDIRVIHLRRRNSLRRLVSRSIAKDTNVWKVYQGHTFASLRDPANVLKAVIHPFRTAKTLRRLFVRTKSVGKAPRAAVVVTVDECKAFFSKELEDASHYDELFSRHPMMTLYYEDLVADYDQTLDHIQTFLGLKPKRLVPATRRQNPGPLRELIENYDELYKAFKDTPAAAFFD